MLIFSLLLLLLIRPPSLFAAGVTPPQSVAPIFYIMNDRMGLLESYKSSSSGSIDRAGALGSWINFSWKSIEPSRGNYSWSAIENYLNSEFDKVTTLKNGQKIKKPIAVSIILLGNVGHQGGDLPDYVFEGNKESFKIYGVDSNGQKCDASCGTDIRPPWETGSFKTGFEGMVKAFAEKYDNDPRINSIWIASGLYGETVIETGNNVGCGCKFNYSGGGNYGNWLSDNHSEWRPNDVGVINIYRKYFKKKPLFIINSAPTGRSETSANAIQQNPPVGIKYNALLHDGPHLNTDPNSQWPQSVKYWLQADKDNKQGMSGFEHAYAANLPDTYWSMLTAVSRRTTLIDLPISIEQNSKFFEMINLMQKSYENAESSGVINHRENSADFFPMWSFMEDHFGRDVTNTPDLWIALRDTEFKTYQPPWGNRLGEPGDYEYFLYRPENFDDDYPYDSGFGKGQVRPQDNVDRPQAKTISQKVGDLPTSSHTQFIRWDGRSFIRRTDQKTDNRYMYFQADNRWPAANQEISGFDIEVTFYDLGTDTFSLKYSNGTIQTITKTKQDTKKFVKETFSVPSGIFKTSVNGFGDHFFIDCNLDGDEYIHMIRIIPKTWKAPCWDFGPLLVDNGKYCSSAGDVTSTPIRPTPTPPVCSCPSGISKLQSGDVNCDGETDVVDFSLWKIEFIQKGTVSQASDLNCDNKVDIFDFAVWKTAFVSRQKSLF